MPRTQIFLLIVAVLAVLYFLPNLLTGGVLFPLDILYHTGPYASSAPEQLSHVRNPQLADLVTMIYPWTDFFRSAEERLPLWNPYSFCGSPLIGSGQTGLLFPLSWIYRVLPIGAASLFVAVGKLIFCGTFGFLFFRRVGFHQIAALLGAIGFMLSGKTVMWLGYPGAFAICTMPFLFWAIETFVVTRRRSSAAWVAVGYGLLFLASQPQFGFVIGMASAIYFVVRAGSGGPSGLRLYLLFTGAALLGFCLAAPQILPFQEYLRESAAFRLRGSFGWKRYPWFTFASWIFPRFFGDWREGIFWGFSSFIGESVYIGGIPLLFAVTGAVLARKSRSCLAAASVFAFGFMGLYLPPVQWIYQRVPLLANLDNDKLTVLVVFGLAFFAASGLDILLSDASRSRALFRIWHGTALLWILFLSVCFLYFHEAIRELRLERFELREAAIHLFFLLLASGVMLLWVDKRLTPVPAGWLIVMLTAADLFRVWINYYPSYPVEYLHPRSSSVAFLQQNAAGARIFGINGFVPPETSILYRLRDVRGVEGLTPYRYYRILEKVDPGIHDALARFQAMIPKGRGWSASTLFMASLKPYLESTDPKLIAALRKLDYWSDDIARIERPWILSVLGVKYLIGPAGSPLPAEAGFRVAHVSDAEVWENPTCLPRTFICSQALIASDDEQALEMISARDFEFQQRAVITAGDRPPGSGEDSKKPGLLAAKITKESPHRIEIEADSPGEGWLILADLFYPGWYASVDGSESTIYPANYMFRAVRLAPGRHTVVFYYRPPTFYWGTLLALIAVSITISAGAAYSPRRNPQ